MRREYQSNKRQHKSGSTYNQVYQVTGGNYPLPPPMDIHVSPTIPHSPPPKHYLDVRQATQFFIDKNVSQMTNVTETTGSIMGGRNKQAYSRSRNNNCETRNVLSKRRIGKERIVPEPPEKTLP